MLNLLNSIVTGVMRRGFISSHPKHVAGKRFDDEAKEEVDSWLKERVATFKLRSNCQKDYKN